MTKECRIHELAKGEIATFTDNKDYADGKLNNHQLAQCLKLMIDCVWYIWHWQYLLGKKTESAELIAPVVNVIRTVAARDYSQECQIAHSVVVVYK